MEAARILVCEDEAIVARDIASRLESYGYMVSGVAADSETALRLARERRPDLALMDVRLRGDVLGTEVAARLAKEFNVPSIFLTAYGDSETLRKASKVDALAYLQKPVRDQELRMAIEFGLKSRRRQRQVRKELEEYRARLEAVEGKLHQGASIDQRMSEALATELTSNVVGGIAHHVNNMLCALNGNLEWLKQCPTIKPFEHRFVEEAWQVGERLRQLVQKLMWASREGLFEQAIVHLQDLVREVAPEFREVCGSSVEISETFPTDPCVVFVSPPAVKKAIAEIMLNGAEAMEGRGTLDLALSEEFVEIPEFWNSSARPGWFYVLSIADSGPGIQVDPLEDVFQPFQTTREERNAMGLGLPMARGIMLGHGGWCTVESKGGAPRNGHGSGSESGTTVKLFFPRVSRGA